MTRGTRPRPAYRRVAIALGCVLAALVLYQYFLQGPARVLDLVTKPEHFSELYFSRPLALPSTESKGEAVHVSFVIADEEQRRSTYHWSVLVVAGGASRREGSGTAVLGAGGAATIAVDFRWPRRRGKAMIEVRLAALHETITAHVASVLPRPTTRSAG